MQLNELDSFKLSDAVTFHDDLNPKLWVNQKLRPEVKKQLLLIAQDFVDELGIHDLDVKDITVSGSNAAYSYTKHSDLDLHILVDLGNMPQDEVYIELFDAKKRLYNDNHDITVHGVPVELYVQDAREPVVSLGEYSILNDKWLRIPTKRRANFDQTASKAKYDKLLDIIKRALKSNDIDKVSKVLKKIKQYRQAGLDKGGEFGPENLAFKALRSQGLIKKLYALRDKLHSEVLTIETMYKKPKQNKLRDKLSKEFSQIADEDWHPNATPPGPEFKPTMPAGTVKVDVSDVYDWYKLGQHISNLHGLGHHDFGKGPPSTVMAFGSEPEEHKYIQDLEKTGLTTTDIDPIDKNQPKGMKRQKVDPTYSVNEKINPEIAKKDFYAEKEINIKDVGPLKLVAHNVKSEHPVQFKVEVIRPDGQSIGYFRFIVMDYDPEPRYKMFSKFSEKQDPYIIGGNVSVWNEYQKKGIATEVYKWVKSMGNDIRPSDTQTPAGQAMWRGFEKNQAVEEDLTLQYASEKTPAINPYGGLKDRQYRGSIAEASGYIPSEKEKNDPRYKMALTVDVKPDAIPKNAKAFYWKTNRAGIPPTARPDGKF